VRQVFGSHGDSEFDFGVETEKPRLGKLGDVGRALEVYDQNPAAVAMHFAEVGGLGLGVFHDLLHFLGRGSIADEGIERLKGQCNLHQYAHENPPGAGN
jgi:hypothetical protein